MKHSIVLQALLSKSSTLKLFYERPETEELTTDDIDTKTVPAGKIPNKNLPIEVISSVWNQFISQSYQDDEILLSVLNPTKRNFDGHFDSETMIRELGESPNQVSKFTYIVTALSVTLSHLHDGGTTTLRDIYYRDIVAFGGKQNNLNLALSLISQSFGFSLLELSIVPSPKGLIWGGNLDLFIGPETSLELKYEKNYQLIPFVSEDSNFSASLVPDAIVVMEKEAVFKSFCEDPPAMELNVIFLTGRGFPDHCTRNFLNCIRKAFPLAPVLVFVDSDVYGIRIFWTYNEKMKNCLYSGMYLSDYQEGLVMISKRDRNLLMKLILLNWNTKKDEDEKKEEQGETEQKEGVSAFSFIENPNSNITSNNNSNLSTSQRNCLTIHRELTRGLLLNAKAEMNILSNPKKLNTVNLSETKNSSRRNYTDYVWSKITKITNTSAGELTCSHTERRKDQ